MHIFASNRKKVTVIDLPMSELGHKRKHPTEPAEASVAGTTETEHSAKKLKTDASDPVAVGDDASASPLRSRTPTRKAEAGVAIAGTSEQSEQVCAEKSSSDKCQHDKGCQNEHTDDEGDEDDEADAKR